MYTPVFDDSRPGGGGPNTGSPYAPGNVNYNYGTTPPPFVNTPAPQQSVTVPVTPPPAAPVKPVVSTATPPIVNPVQQGAGIPAIAPATVAPVTAATAATAPGTPIIAPGTVPAFTIPAANSNTMLYIGIAAVLAIIFFSRK